MRSHQRAVGRLLDSISDLVARLGGIASAVFLVALLVVVVWNMVSRALGRGTIDALFPLTQMLLLGIVFGGLPQTELQNRHIRVELLTDRLAARRRAAVRVLGRLCALVVVVWLAWETTDRALMSKASGETFQGAEDWPVWPIRMLLAGALWSASWMCLMSIRHTVSELRVESADGADGESRPAGPLA